MANPLLISVSAALAVTPVPLGVWEACRFRRAAWLPWASAAYALAATAWMAWLGGPVPAVLALAVGAAWTRGTLLPDPRTWLTDPARRRAAYAALEAARLGGDGRMVRLSVRVVGRAGGGRVVRVVGPDRRSPPAWFRVPDGPGPVTPLGDVAADPKKYPGLEDCRAE